MVHSYYSFCYTYYISCESSYTPWGFWWTELLSDLSIFTALGARYLDGSWRTNIFHTLSFYVSYDRIWCTQTTKKWNRKSNIPRSSWKYFYLIYICYCSIWNTRISRKSKWSRCNRSSEMRTKSRFCSDTWDARSLWKCFCIFLCMSLVEAIAIPIKDKFSQFKWENITAGIIMLVGLVSILYMQGNGLYILDIVDHYVTQFAMLAMWLIELLLFIKYRKPLLKFIEQHNDWRYTLLNNTYFMLSWIFWVVGKK